MLRGELFLAICVAAAASQPGDTEYDRGMALARQQRWEEARLAFEAGRRQVPRDKRFPIELAGIAFRQEHYAESKALLRSALRLDPSDVYANNFLGTLYFLDSNLEAALAFWNRAGRPVLRNIEMDPEPRLDPLIVAHALAFSRGSLLSLPEFRAAKARLDLLDVFSSYRFELVAADNDRFDLLFRSREQHALLERFGPMLVSLPFQSVSLNLKGLGATGVNIRSLARWDHQKRRAFFSLAAPLARNPSWGFRVYGDGRSENWAIPATHFHMNRVLLGTEVSSVASEAWRWRAGLEIANRKFRDNSFAGGTSLKYLAGLEHPLLRVPERRLSVFASGSAELARWFGRGMYGRWQTGVTAHWLPQAQGEDIETRLRLRAGSTSGEAPFDDLFLVGVERDSDLWLRGHSGTRGGRKGSSPLGRRYALASWELDKTLLKISVFRVSAGPFLDAGRAWGFGSDPWMCDAGLAVKVRAFGGMGLVISYGRGLVDGRHALFAGSVR